MMGELRAFAYAFCMVFLAELGDKTQLAILALSLRGNRAYVLLGSFLAFSLVNGLSAAFGYLLFTLAPYWLLSLALGAILVLVGSVGLVLEFYRGRRSVEEQEGGPALDRKPSLLGSFALVALAELGDKTQLATISSSALTGSVLTVILAAISALVSMTALTCAIGGKLAGMLHGAKARLASYAVFVAAGILMLVSTCLVHYGP